MAQLQGAGGGAPAAPPGAWMPRLSGWSDEVRPSLGKMAATDCLASSFPSRFPLTGLDERAPASYGYARASHSLAPPCC